MARFYFHRRNGAGLFKDPDGSDLPDLDAARAEALEAARQLWAAAIIVQRDLSDDSFEITDDHGRHLMSPPFSKRSRPSMRRE